MNARTYRRDCLLGTLGALLMLVGDLCLSWIPAFPGDAGLFAREAYLNGSYPAWRLPLLLGAEFPGIALCIFTVRASLAQVRPEHRKLRAVIAVSGGVYVTSAGVIHLFIGSLADWTSTLSPPLRLPGNGGAHRRQVRPAGPHPDPPLRRDDRPDPGQRLGPPGEKDLPAPADVPFPHADVAADFRPDPRHPPGPRRDRLHLGLCPEPGLRKRRSGHLDAGQRPLGPKSFHRGGCFP